MSHNDDGSSERAHYQMLLFVLAAALSGLLLFLSQAFVFSCLLSFLVSIVLPFGAVLLTTPRTIKVPIRNGILAGLLIGIVGATSQVVVDGVQYFLLGDRVRAFSELGQSPPLLTFESLIREVWVYVLIWLIHVVISSLAGMVGVVLARTGRIR